MFIVGQGHCDLVLIGSRGTQKVQWPLPALFFTVPQLGGLRPPEYAREAYQPACRHLRKEVKGEQPRSEEVLRQGGKKGWGVRT